MHIWIKIIKFQKFQWIHLHVSIFYIIYLLLYKLQTQGLIWIVFWLFSAFHLFVLCLWGNLKFSIFLHLACRIKSKWLVIHPTCEFTMYVNQLFSRLRLLRVVQLVEGSRTVHQDSDLVFSLSEWRGKDAKWSNWVYLTF